MFITTLERMIADPAPVLSALMDFLGADSTFVFEEDVRLRNPNWAMTPKPWACTGVAGMLARGYDKTARIAVKALTHDRDRRRELLGRLKAPFFVLAAGQKMDPQTRNELRAFYRPHAAALEDMLGRALDEWPDLTSAGE